MTANRKSAVWAAAILVAAAMGPTADAQTAGEPTCAEKLTEQLRRFNEQCIGDLVTFTAAMPKGVTRIASEKDKYYVELSTKDNGLQGESVSKQNYPFLTAETESKLKDLGWTPPDVEHGGFKRMFGDQDVKSGRAAQAVIQALQAYGMQPGEAISVTVTEAAK